ncbi:MAG: VOC family protein, partial [Microthrixaceae bacterium]|nr:VOC family protein [Microthrixaceae bacterium]
TLHIGDAPSAWTQAGFAVATRTDDFRNPSVVLGGVRLVLHGDGGPRGLLRWDLIAAAADERPRPGDLDGLPTAWVNGKEAPWVSSAPTDAHPNGITGLDHVVITSPDVARTTSALAEVGFEARRTRQTDDYGTPMRQVFFWAGKVIVELVGPLEPTATAPTLPDAGAGFFGLAMTSDDLDATAAAMGEALGAPRPAVQEGRRIASLRFNRLGGSVATVVMSPHARDLERG